jgi:hypothetical protein
MKTLLWLIGIFIVIVIPIFTAIFIYNGLHDPDEEYPWWDDEDYMIGDDHTDWGDKS